MIWFGVLITITLYLFNLWLVLTKILPHNKLKPVEKIAWTIFLIVMPFIGLWIYTLAGRPAAKRFHSKRAADI
jgi:hypothetical protein